MREESGFDLREFNRSVFEDLMGENNRNIFSKDCLRGVMPSFLGMVCSAFIYSAFKNKGFQDLVDDKNFYSFVCGTSLMFFFAPHIYSFIDREFINKDRYERNIPNLRHLLNIIGNYSFRERPIPSPYTISAELLFTQRYQGRNQD